MTILQFSVHGFMDRLALGFGRARGMDGTLAEAASPCLHAGDRVTLTVILHDSRIPENAFMRIESAPLATEHVVAIKLANEER